MSNVIDYFTLSSAANASDFGDLSGARQHHNATGNTTRGIFGGGSYTGVDNSTIDYVNIASTGGVTDFGDLIGSGANYMNNGTAASSTRALFMGGAFLAGEFAQSVNVIQYITIASTGDAQDFGDLTSTIQWVASTSNATKAVSGGGYDDRNNDSTAYNAPYGIKIDVVVIASTGNATDFGDLTERGRNGTAACGSQGGLS